MNLILSEKIFSIYKIKSEQFSAIYFLSNLSFVAFSKTENVYTLIAESNPLIQAEKEERDWMAFSVEGAISFSSAGVLCSIIAPLSQNGISVLAVSTFDTDYIFFKRKMLSEVLSILQEQDFKFLIH